MSEIRNLTRNGETFYPLTCTDALLNRDGNPVETINDIFDVSEYNASGTPPVLAKYASLDLALAAIPEAKRKGGMSMRYVQTSDNKYVQFRLMLSTFTAAQFVNANNWQGVDENPKPESKNFVESGGIFDGIYSLYLRKYFTFTNANTFIVSGTGAVQNGNNYSTTNFINLKYFEKIIINLSTTSGVATLAFYSAQDASTYISDIGMTTKGNFIVIDKSDFPEGAEVVRLCKRDDYSEGGYAYRYQNLYEQYHDELVSALAAEVERATGAEGGLQTNITNLANKTVYTTKQTLTDTQIKRLFANLGISGIDTTIYKKDVPNFTAGKYLISGTGNTDNGTTFSVTDYINIENVSVIELQLYTNGIATSLAFYGDRNVSSYISDIGNTGQNSLTVITKADFPQGAKYIRICKRNDYDGTATLYSCPFTKVDKLFYDIEVTGWYSSKYINNTNGNIENGSDFSITGSYLTENIQSIKLFIGTSGVAAPLAFYDKNGKFISALGSLTMSAKLIIYAEDFPSNTYYIKIGKRDSLSLNGSVIITYRKESARNEWKNRVMLAYGDSVTAICNGDSVAPFQKTDYNYLWGQRAAKFFKMSAFYGRGIGGQKFCWITDGGSLSWVNKATGQFVGRDYTHTYEDYLLNPSMTPTVSTGSAYNSELHYLVRGASCSWLRITKMIPAEIKDSIDVITIMYHNDADVASEALDADVQWVAGSNIDKEWASSDIYSTYNGDYNINTVKGGIASTIMKIQAWMPKVRIILMTPISGRGGSSGQLNKNLTDANMQKLAEAVRDMHKLMSIPLVDMYATCGINGLNRNLYIADSIHPYTERGGNAIASALVGGLNGITPLMSVFG